MWVSARNTPKPSMCSETGRIRRLGERLVVELLEQAEHSRVVDAFDASRYSANSSRALRPRRCSRAARLACRRRGVRYARRPRGETARARRRRGRPGAASRTKTRSHASPVDPLSSRSSASVPRNRAQRPSGVQRRGSTRAGTPGAASTSEHLLHVVALRRSRPGSASPRTTSGAARVEALRAVEMAERDVVRPTGKCTASMPYSLATCASRSPPPSLPPRTKQCAASTLTASGRNGCASASISTRMRSA